MKSQTDNYTMLLINAERLIETSGYDSLSIRNLAKESKVSTGFLYNYFENKEALTNALMEHFYHKHLHHQICTLDHQLSFIDYLDDLIKVLNNPSYDQIIHNEVLAHHKQHFMDGLKQVYLADKSITLGPDNLINTDNLIEFIVNVLLQDPKPSFQVLRLLLQNTLYRGE